MQKILQPPAAFTGLCLRMLALLCLTQAASAQVPLANAVQVVSGDNHSCALTQTGSVKCWGDNSYGQLGDGTTVMRSSAVDVVGLQQGVSFLAAGFRHTCAVVSEGRVKCWGWNGNGNLGDGSRVDRHAPAPVTGLRDITMVSTGLDHTCALSRAGELSCWGNNRYGQLGIDRGSVLTPHYVIGLRGGVVLVKAGNDFTCATTSSGETLCWGNNLYGQLGDGTTTHRLAPEKVRGLPLGIIDLATGARHTCALTAQRQVYCWGDNSAYQLNSSGEGRSVSPVLISGLNEPIADVSAGHQLSCVATISGIMQCWGRNDSRFLDVRAVPESIPDLRGVKAVATGLYHACALDDQAQVHCVGNDAQGQLGANTLVNRVSPGVEIDGLEPGVRSIAVGYTYPNLFTPGDNWKGSNCALLLNGAVKCWGANETGQLGNGSTVNSAVPVDVVGLDSGVRSIHGGGYHRCAVMEGGGAKCWGSNSRGQLGDGSTTSSHVPVDVIGLTQGVVDIAVNGSHTCALLEDRTVACWGANNVRQLGNASTSNASRPVKVVGVEARVLAIAVEPSLSCAVLDQGEVYCWGVQIGEPRRFIEVGTGVLAKAITAGLAHTCILTFQDQVKCWGRASEGQLGYGTLARPVPLEVPGLGAPVRAVVAGGYHTCATMVDDRVMCWGYGYSGQLGNNDPNPRSPNTPFNQSNMPVQVVGLTGEQILQLSLATEHSCALVASGSVRCWGSNRFGELGVGEGTFATSPKRVIEGQRNFSYLYWNPAEPGWGLTVQHQGDRIFGTWYTYADDGKPMFLTVEAQGLDNGTYTGPIYRVVGRPFSQIDNQPAFASSQQIGVAQLTFSHEGELKFAYTLHGAYQSKRLQQFRFNGAAPTCKGSKEPRTGADNYSDLWWNPQEPGWGLGLSHQGDAILLQWYTYDGSGRDQWMVGATLNKQADGSFAGELLRPDSGTPLAQINNSAATDFPVPNVGSATLRFIDGQAGMFAYTVDGIERNKPITRFVTGGPDEDKPVCLN